MLALVCSLTHCLAQQIFSYLYIAEQLWQVKLKETNPKLSNSLLGRYSSEMWKICLQVPALNWAEQRFKARSKKCLMQYFSYGRICYLKIGKESYHLGVPISCYGPTVTTSWSCNEKLLNCANSDQNEAGLKPLLLYLYHYTVTIAVGHTIYISV